MADRIIEVHSDGGGSSGALTVLAVGFDRRVGGALFRRRLSARACKERNRYQNQ